MATTIGRYTFYVKAHLPLIFLDDADMDNPSRKVLADNLARLMRLGEPDHLTQAVVGKKAGCNQRTIGRLLTCDQAPTTDILDGLASAFDLMAWQLLVPGLDPGNPPVNHVTEAEKRLYERLKEAARMVMDSEPPNKYG